MENNLIFEELSISDDVLNITNDIVPLIFQEIEKDDGRIFRSQDNSFLLKQTSIKLDEPIFGIINNIIIQAIYFVDKNEYKNFFGAFSFGGETNVDTKEIILTIFGINNQINQKFLMSTLTHELKHCYQLSLYNNATDIPKLYKTALYYMNLGYGPLYIMELSRLLYFFDKNEINANMESLYQELKYSNGKIERNNILNEYEACLEDYRNLKDFLFDDKAMKEIKELFHKSLKELLKYIENRIEYFNIRKRKVFQKFKQEQVIEKSLKNSFKRYLL